MLPRDLEMRLAFGLLRLARRYNVLCVCVCVCVFVDVCSGVRLVDSSLSLSLARARSRSPPFPPSLPPTLPHAPYLPPALSLSPCPHPSFFSLELFVNDVKGDKHAK